MINIEDREIADRGLAAQVRAEERRNWAQRVEVLQEQLRASEERYMALVRHVASGAAFQAPVVIGAYSPITKPDGVL